MPPIHSQQPSCFHSLVWRKNFGRFISARMRPTPVTCPICSKPADFFAEPVGPFCSNRCKMIDLGKWLNEDYRITEPLRPDHLEEYEAMSGEELDKPERRMDPE
jgi:endogenous inhibitor of DNA gyrase (YacG/DUF329 family)